MSFKANTIYIGLTIRYPTEGDPENYHWLLWLRGEEEVGVCLHANNRSGAFKFEEKPWSAATSQSLSAIVSIGSLAGQNVAALTALLKAIPMETPAQDKGQVFNCRVWVREAVRILQAHGVLKCDSVDELQAEVIHYADKNRSDVETGKARGGIYASAHSR